MSPARIIPMAPITATALATPKVLTTAAVLRAFPSTDYRFAGSYALGLCGYLLKPCHHDAAR